MASRKFIDMVGKSNTFNACGRGEGLTRANLSPLAAFALNEVGMNLRDEILGICPDLTTDEMMEIEGALRQEEIWQVQRESLQILLDWDPTIYCKCGREADMHKNGQYLCEVCDERQLRLVKS